MKDKYTYEEFLEIIKTLRSENGCPWDREQTHESLRPCMMEEAAELLAAIRILKKTNNPENLIEELGDVLLQVVLYAQIASEEGLFSMEDVVNRISEKMVHRHPHVFGEEKADSTALVLKNWDEIKKKEKEGKDWIESPLKEIPAELPALSRATKILRKADKFYGKRHTLKEDIDELQRALDVFKSVEEEKEEAEYEKCQTQVGNMLMALMNITSKYDMFPEQILTDRIEDFIEECEG